MNRISVLLIIFGLLLDGCCNEDFITPSGDYDFRDGATNVTSILNARSCSADEAYTTEGATPDGEDSNCGSPDNNRWFKFTAPASGQIWMSVHVGTQTETRIALWDTDGTSELICETYFYPGDDVFLDYGPLTPGKVYYLSVDCTSDTIGTFSLCLSDTD